MQSRECMNYINELKYQIIIYFIKIGRKKLVSLATKR